MQPRRYLAIFAPGFERAVGELLDHDLPDAMNREILSGMALFNSAKTIETISGLAFFNNVFLILRAWDTARSPFHDLVKSSSVKSDLRFHAEALSEFAGGTFRVRFSRENQFCSVDKSLTTFAEQFIARATGLRPNRLDPGIEFWFVIRREERSFFTARLTKKPSTEKYLARGELRPEIARLIAAHAGITPSDRVLLDPFAGHGAIPAQLAALCGESIIYASDIDPDLSSELSRRFAGNGNVRTRNGDALHLEWIASSSVDLIVTDPPWGAWNADAYSGERSIENLYRGMLTEFARVLSVRGRAYILTGAKKEFADAVARSSAFAHCAAMSDFRTDILINGKKSAIFALDRKGEVYE